jgi:hypothetical protein
MRKGGGDRLLVAGVVAIGAVAIAAWVWRRKPPALPRDWGSVTSLIPSSLANWTSNPDGSASADAAAPLADAGVVVRRQAAPLSSAQLGAPLVHGTFVAACGAPDDMKVVVHLDVKKGHASNVSVKTQPPNATVTSCIERSIRDLRWDISPHPGHVTVTY